MACPFEDVFLEVVLKDPPAVWALVHMEECPECAEAYEIASLLRDQGSAVFEGVRPVSFLDGLGATQKRWLLWMSGDKPLFSGGGT